MKCPFCGINGIPREYHHMDWDTAERVAQGIRDAGWTSRIEFAMRGEPTHNPLVVQLVQLFRRMLPDTYLLMETNGYGLVRDNELGPSLLRAGLSTLALGEYQNVKWAAQMRERWPGWAEYPAHGPKVNPHRRTKGQRRVIVAPIDLASVGSHSQLNNHCGAGGPLEQLNERCAKPFREISVRYDGSVAVCCNDWRGTLPIGNVNDLTITDIWRHPRMEAARRYLYHGRREVGPCAGCNAKSYRTGLLPDKLGKQTLPQPTTEDLATLEAALAEGPLAEPVLRPWELK